MDIIRLFSNELIVKHERMLQGFPTEMTEESKNNNGQNFRHREKYNQLNIWEVWNFVFISWTIFSSPDGPFKSRMLKKQKGENIYSKNDFLKRKFLYNQFNRLRRPTTTTTTTTCIIRNSQGRFIADGHLKFVPHVASCGNKIENSKRQRKLS